LLGATHGGDFNAGAGVSAGTNGVSVYEHGANYMPALAVYSGPLGAGAAVISVNYSNKQPVLYVQGNLARAGVASSRARVTAPTNFHLSGFRLTCRSAGSPMAVPSVLSSANRRPARRTQRRALRSFCKRRSSRTPPGSTRTAFNSP